MATLKDMDLNTLYSPYHHLCFAVKRTYDRDIKMYEWSGVFQGVGHYGGTGTTQIPETGNCGKCSLRKAENNKVIITYAFHTGFRT